MAQPTIRTITGYIKIKLPRNGAPNVPMWRVQEMLDAEWVIERKKIMDRVEEIRKFHKRIMS